MLKSEESYNAIQFIKKFRKVDQNWYTRMNMVGQQPRKFSVMQVHHE